MQHMSRRVQFFCVVWYAIGAVQVVLSSLNAQAHTGAYVNPFAEVDTVESGIESGAHSLIDSTNLRNEHGNIPQGYEERKTEIQSIASDRNELKREIDQLIPVGKFVTVRSELKKLHGAFRKPSQERVRQLGGLELHLDPHSFTSNADSFEPATTHASNAYYFPQAGSQGNSFTNLNIGQTQVRRRKAKISNLFNPTPTSRGTSSRLPPVLEYTDHELTPLTSSSDEQQFLAHKPSDALELNKSSSSSSTPTVLEAFLKEKNIPIGDLLKTKAGEDLPASEKIKTLNALHNLLLEFKSSDRLPNPAEAEFQLNFLRSFFLLGDYIMRYELLPSEVIGTVEIFKSKNLVEMVEWHTQLLFHKLGRDFFESPESVVPELEFLTSGRAVKHFHRSIKALPDEGQKQVVHAVLGTILSRWPNQFLSDQEVSPSARFSQIRQSFFDAKLLEGAGSHSSAITRLPDTKNHIEQDDRLRLIRLTEDLVTFFEGPEMTKALNQRIEYQLVWYMLDFISHYHLPILQEVVRKRDQNWLPRQFIFMTSHFRKYRNRNVDNTPGAKEYDMGPFKEILSHQIKKNRTFIKWINTYIFKIFPYTGWTYPHESDKYLRLNLWMGFFDHNKFPARVHRN
ncbi:uncharacterized protein PGTG_10159 [Puccinia graminis f. sp. tritici CRL 75-36-700-3]|uniref:Uncharacterized protein n=1 Tax=Puccinia graminis f. sp. tritici (strain CRL 75-36-700-3 / race SCCL) TaxID=418459 RepID=E3KJG4_PUCGT|nr:uncharacterized protein PGTG_10159 [Puccinia graminis f. sp. tritici CRL 75-36-700-3]EFP84439.1 hypothetical protein PGTG_10159 [Puccinia graminis f. sp. tritici CRL 75-36-700-3]